MKRRSFLAGVAAFFGGALSVGGSDVITPVPLKISKVTLAHLSDLFVPIEVEQDLIVEHVVMDPRLLKQFEKNYSKNHYDIHAKREGEAHLWNGGPEGNIWTAYVWAKETGTVEVFGECKYTDELKCRHPDIYKTIAHWYEGYCLGKISR